MNKSRSAAAGSAASHGSSSHQQLRHISSSASLSTAASSNNVELFQLWAVRDETSGAGCEEHISKEGKIHFSSTAATGTTLVSGIKPSQVLSPAQAAEALAGPPRISPVKLLHNTESATPSECGQSKAAIQDQQRDLHVVDRDRLLKTLLDQMPKITRELIRLIKRWFKTRIKLVGSSRSGGLNSVTLTILALKFLFDWNIDVFAIEKKVEEGSSCRTGSCTTSAGGLVNAPVAAAAVPPALGHQAQGQPLSGNAEDEIMKPKSRRFFHLEVLRLFFKFLQYLCEFYENAVTPRPGGVEQHAVEKPADFSPSGGVTSGAASTETMPSNNIVHMHRLVLKDSSHVEGANAKEDPQDPRRDDPMSPSMGGFPASEQERIIKNNLPYHFEHSPLPVDDASLLNENMLFFLQDPGVDFEKEEQMKSIALGDFVEELATGTGTASGQQQQHQQLRRGVVTKIVLQQSDVNHDGLDGTSSFYGAGAGGVTNFISPQGGSLYGSGGMMNSTGLLSGLSAQGAAHAASGNNNRIIQITQPDFLDKIEVKFSSSTSTGGTKGSTASSTTTSQMIKKEFLAEEIWNVEVFQLTEQTALHDMFLQQPIGILGKGSKVLVLSSKSCSPEGPETDNTCAAAGSEGTSSNCIVKVRVLSGVAPNVNAATIMSSSSGGGASSTNAAGRGTTSSGVSVAGRRKLSSAAPEFCPGADSVPGYDPEFCSYTGASASMHDQQSIDFAALHHHMSGSSWADHFNVAESFSQEGHPWDASMHDGGGATRASHWGTGVAAAAAYGDPHMASTATNGSTASSFLDLSSFFAGGAIASTATAALQRGKIGWVPRRALKKLSSSTTSASSTSSRKKVKIKPYKNVLIPTKFHLPRMLDTYNHALYTLGKMLSNKVFREGIFFPEISAVVHNAPLGKEKKNPLLEKNAALIALLRGVEEEFWQWPLQEIITTPSQQERPYSTRSMPYELLPEGRTPAGLFPFAETSSSFPALSSTTTAARTSSGQQQPPHPLHGPQHADSQPLLQLPTEATRGDSRRSSGNKPVSSASSVWDNVDIVDDINPASFAASSRPPTTSTWFIETIREEILTRCPKLALKAILTSKGHTAFKQGPPVGVHLQVLSAAAKHGAVAGGAGGAGASSSGGTTSAEEEMYADRLKQIVEDIRKLATARNSCTTSATSVASSVVTAQQQQALINPVESILNPPLDVDREQAPLVPATGPAGPAVLTSAFFSSHGRKQQDTNTKAAPGQGGTTGGRKKTNPMEENWSHPKWNYDSSLILKLGEKEPNCTTSGHEQASISLWALVARTIVIREA
ncbi:unnamed protein product [Amoebophrya sp. A120]|nr:unnamed protein product [Amoebophrya sp. A120]|eukprot:GSA120T00007069001.1